MIKYNEKRDLSPKGRLRRYKKRLFGIVRNAGHIFIDAQTVKNMAPIKVINL